MKKWLLLLILAFLSSSSFANEVVTIETKQHTLLKNGWSALVLKCENIKEKESKWRYNDAPDIFSAGIKSVHSCQGSGDNLCSYYYEKSGECLKLVTSGEFAYKGLKGLIVEREYFQCPEKC
jgi:hypothetical protein